MTRWWCTRCGKPADAGPWPPETEVEKTTPSGQPLTGTFTQIDGRGRYDLGHCECTPRPALVELVNDPIVAELAATR